MNFDFNLSVYDLFIYAHAILLGLAIAVYVIKYKWKYIRHILLKPSGYRKAQNILHLSGKVLSPALALSMAFIILTINYVSPQKRSYDMKAWDSEEPALYDMELLPPRTRLFKEKKIEVPKPKTFEIEPVIELPNSIDEPVLVQTAISSDDVEVTVSTPIEEKLSFRTPEPPPIIEEEPEIYVRSEIMPVFPGCDSEEGTAKEKESCTQNSMLEYIYGHLNYPAIARENGVEGMAFIQFIVNDGVVSEVQILRDPGGGLGKEALKVVEQMKNVGLWTPGFQQGRKVKVKYTLPIKFQLQ